MALFEYDEQGNMRAGITGGRTRRQKKVRKPAEAKVQGANPLQAILAQLAAQDAISRRNVEAERETAQLRARTAREASGMNLLGKLSEHAMPNLSLRREIIGGAGGQPQSREDAEADRMAARRRKLEEQLKMGGHLRDIHRKTAADAQRWKSTPSGGEIRTRFTEGGPLATIRPGRPLDEATAKQIREGMTAQAAQPQEDVLGMAALRRKLYPESHSPGYEHGRPSPTLGTRAYDRSDITGRRRTTPLPAFRSDLANANGIPSIVPGQPEPTSGEIARLLMQTGPRTENPEVVPGTGIGYLGLEDAVRMGMQPPPIQPTAEGVADAGRRAEDYIAYLTRRAQQAQATPTLPMAMTMPQIGAPAGSSAAPLIGSSPEFTPWPKTPAEQNLEEQTALLVQQRRERERQSAMASITPGTPEQSALATQASRLTSALGGSFMRTDQLGGEALRSPVNQAQVEEGGRAMEKLAQLLGKPDGRNLAGAIQETPWYTGQLGPSAEYLSDPGAQQRAQYGAYSWAGLNPIAAPLFWLHQKMSRNPAVELSQKLKAMKDLIDTTATRQ